MLKLNTLIVLLTICSSWQISAKEYFYNYKGKKIFLELNTEYIFVSGTNENSIANIKIDNDFIDKEEPSEIIKDNIDQIFTKPIGFAENYPDRYWKEIKLKEELSSENYIALIEQLKNNNSNLIFAPYFKTETINIIGLSNYFKVKLKDQRDYNILLDKVAEYNVELVGYDGYMPLWYMLSANPDNLNALQMANIFDETDLFECAEPDLMAVQSTSSSENPHKDLFFKDQWHLSNIGQNGGKAGIDINVLNAWGITKGAGTKVAIFDSGVDVGHPDLMANIADDGYDLDTQDKSTLGADAHGTFCAGIIGAKENKEEGIIGVAPLSGLIPISASKQSSLYNGSKMAMGFNWATKPGNEIDIISNSWLSTESAHLDDAINNALINGRNGLGMIVVFASGNDNINGAQYPSNINPDILCVGAIDRCGTRSGRADVVEGPCEPWCPACPPGSSFGAPLDVVAGGTNIYSTDIKGEPGYDDGNYHEGFYGTSAACAMVAGIAALVLSVNPNLTAKQVNNVIEQTAQNINTNKYSYEATENRQNGLWNEELGYGLVDAHKAVQLAQELLVCKKDITIKANAENKLPIQNEYSSTNNIVTDQTISNKPDVIISETYQVDFKAEHIQLNAGFKVENGACLNATIEPCE